MSKQNEKRDRPITVQDEMASLLPFYITGRLGLRDQMRVEQWVKDGPQGQKALENAYADQRAAIDANEAIASPSGALGRLLMEIDAEPSQAWSNYVGGNMASWIMSWLNIIPSTFTWGALAALLLVTSIQSTLLWKSVEPPSYEIASGADKLLTGIKKSDTIAYIRFIPGSGISDLSALLNAAGARIIDGPRGNNAYLIALRKDAKLPLAAQRINMLAKRSDLVHLVIEQKQKKD